MTQLITLLKVEDALRRVRHHEKDLRLLRREELFSWVHLVKSIAETKLRIKRHRVVNSKPTANRELVRLRESLL